jgi:HEAT repeat protein
MIAAYVTGLSGPRVEDARHSLIESGPASLPQLIEAYRASPSRKLRLALIEIVSQYRTSDAAPFLHDALRDDDPELWRTALDGLVMLGNDRALKTLVAARDTVPNDRRAWIDEAVEQIKNSADRGSQETSQRHG